MNNITLKFEDIFSGCTTTKDLVTDADSYESVVRGYEAMIGKGIHHFDKRSQIRYQWVLSRVIHNLPDEDEEWDGSCDGCGQIGYIDGTDGLCMNCGATGQI